VIIACISTYRDDNLLYGAIESARYLDAVLVAEGPVGKGKKNHGEPQVPTEGTTARRIGGWESDAAKRSYMLAWAKHVHQASELNTEPLWVLWLDGDEVLLWGEYLRDMAARAEEETGAGGFPLRLVELNGSVVMCQGKVINAGAIRRYLHSSYQVELHSGMVVALPNVPICTAGGMPVKPEGGWQMPPEEMDAWLGRHRPPVAGEPHLLHRSVLRSTTRDVERLSTVEGEWFEEATKAAGLEGVDKP
jgi:hypothetical protein